MRAANVSTNWPFPSYLVSVSKRVLAQNLSFGKEFDLHENEHVGGTLQYELFRTKTRLDAEAKATRKWPISLLRAYSFSST